MGRVETVSHVYVCGGGEAGGRPLVMCVCGAIRRVGCGPSIIMWRRGGPACC